MGKMVMNHENISMEEVIRTGREVLEIEIQELQSLKNRLNKSFFDAVRLMMECQGKVVVTGVGKSGAVARKIAATLSSTGTPALFLHAGEGLHGDLGVITENDVVICISKSGNSDEINAILPALKKMEVNIIGMTSNPNSVLAKYSTVVLDISVDKEACPINLAPTASTTVTMALGDALAVTLLKLRKFTPEDFAFFHPGGVLGKRLLVKVDDLMETGEKVGRVKIHQNMKDAVIEMASKRGICVVLDDDEKLVGVITTGDLNRLVQKTEQFFHIPVTDIMSRNPRVVHEGTLAYTAFKMMEEYRVIAMPVIDAETRVKGIIHLHDIMRAGIA